MKAEAPPSPTSSAPYPRSNSRKGHPIIEALPGLLMCLAIAAAAIRVAEVDYVKKTLHLGALLLVILFGMLWKNVLPPPNWALPGIAVAQRPVLRWGVAFLGFKLSLDKLHAIGTPALVVVLVSTVAALLFGWWFGKALGLDERLAILLGVGGSICGASAIVAAETVVKGERKDVAASIGVITLFGTLGIVLYPLIGRALGMPPFLYGVWTGASLHETAQVLAAGQALGADDVATVVKLARIALLAPIVFYLAYWMRKSGKDAEAKVELVPWFLVLFLVFAVLNSTPWMRPDVAKWINEHGNVWVLCVGMAGVGLQTGFKDLKAAGWTAVLVGLAQWVLISLVAFTLGSILCRTPQQTSTPKTQNSVIVPRPT